MIIPKIIHRIWIGPRPLPDKFKFDFATLMPNWKVVDWTEYTLKHTLTVMRDHFLAAKNTSNKANAARVELLYNFGGVYLDTDVVPLRSFDSLIKDKEFFCAYESPMKFIGFAVVGSAPAHPAIADALHLYKMQFNPNPVNAMSQIVGGGPGLFTKAILPKHRYTLIPADLIYPTSPGQSMSVEEAKRKGAYTLHLWDGSWKEEYKGS